jgi:hypothetical protein
MITPESRESDLQLANRASTTRNPRTGKLEVYDGETDIAPHVYQAPEEGQSGCQAVVTQRDGAEGPCGYPADSQAHRVPETD